MITSIVLATTALPSSPPELASDLSSAGFQVLGQCECHVLVREVVRLAPDAVVIWEPLPGPLLFEATALLASAAPCPVLVFTSDVRVEPMERALSSGIHGWVVNGYAPERLRPLLQLAQARWRIETALRAELTEVTRRYDERKLVDRAKGLLMHSRRVSEDEAFRLLRSASMQSKMRLGQVSQQIIDAAQGGEAVNRAGRLRMLSQRIVKLCALRLAAVEVAGSRALLADSRQQVEQILQHLERGLSRPTFGDLLSAVSATWSDLRTLLDAPASMARLAQIDGLGDQLLARAERLTRALAGAAPGATLEVINVAGRQRMWTQRLAKLALLRGLGPEHPGDGGAAGTASNEAEAEAIASFEASLSFLRGLPLSTPAIQADLAGVDASWRRMLQGVACGSSGPGRLDLAAASEELLALFDRLTGEYERGMQLLMG